MKIILTAIALQMVTCYAHADVTVPVPGDIGAPMSTFELNGTPGSGQNDSFDLFACKTDGSGQVVKFSCKYYKLDGKLNQSFSIPVGYYAVRYSNSIAYFTLQPNQPLLLSLQKIIVPGDRAASFNVFVDLTDKAMQDDVLYRYWLGDESDYTKHCPSKNRALQATCDALTSSDYHRLFNTLITFTADGQYSVLGSDGKYSAPSRGTITDPKSGEFVSVLPGVYAIEFKDDVTQKTEIQYNIRVQ